MRLSFSANRLLASAFLIVALGLLLGFAEIPLAIDFRATLGIASTASGPATIAMASPDVEETAPEVETAPENDLPPAVETEPTQIPAIIPIEPTSPAPSATGPIDPIDPLPLATTRLLREEAASIQLASSQRLIKDGDTIALAEQVDGSYVAEGSLVSEQYLSERPFDNVVLSWNAEAPLGTSLEFQTRVGSGDSASPWFTMGTWRPSGGASATGQANAWGRVNVDTLELAGRAEWLQYRVNFTTGDPSASPRLRSIAVVYADMSVPLDGPAPSVAEGWARDLPVPQFSQLEQDPAVARAICSPTSLAMVIDFWGQDRSVPEVYKAVRDARSGIFGNWPLNVAYAGALGLDAYVDRFYSMEQLQNEIAAGRPVIISIQYGPGKLANAYLNSTSGHLIVVRGFTSEGDIIVNDPFNPTSATVRRVYRRDQLGKIWQDSGGIVYIVRPR